MSKASKSENRETIYKLTLAFNEAASVTTLEDADEILIASGKDPKEVGNNIEIFAQELLRKSPHNWRNRAKQAATSTVEEIKGLKPLKNTRKQMEDAIEAVYARQPALSVHHRNFSEASEEDLARLLAQLKYLEKQKGTGAGEDD